MSIVNVNFTLKNAELLKGALLACPQEARKAAAAAASRVVTHVKSRISVEVRKNYAVKASVVKKSLFTKRPSISANLIGGVVGATGSQLPLTMFMISHSARRPLNVRVKKSGGGPVPGLFWGGRSGLAIRRDPMGNTTSRLPIKNPGGPSVPQMIENEEVWAAIDESASAMLNDRLIHELQYRLGKVSL
ncbi:hypothetical protein ACTUHY_00385 [Acidaminococcus sp. LBK-2]|uniref:hypothetical protein n=1 Tax=Acidaminococcus sp. LBK-2 TaxID=3456956 RepID=UPI003FA4D441